MAAFMAGQGGDPIQQALQRRGMGNGVTTQISQGSPSFDPSMQQPPLPPGGGPPPTQPGQPQQPPMPQGVPQPQGTSESRVIVGALKSRLELLGKMGQ